jgi:uncharacterized protein YbjT (DUF2867 family)/uncharacterized membrane protein
MRVLVTGAYGLIGSACMARLHVDGHDLVAAGRAIVDARRRFPYAQWIEADFMQLRDAQAWRPLLGGIDAVVNCVGVLQDGAGDDVQRIQFDGTAALFDGCARAGVKRVIHISAVGAQADGPSAFSRTKAAAEAHLRTLALDWVILRPALLLAPAAYGGSAMLRGIAGFPGCMPLIGVGARVQVIGADDVAETVVRSLAPGAPGKVAWELAHPQVHTLADIVVALRAWLGFAPRRVLRLPAVAGKIVAFCADVMGWLGWRSPARTTSFAALTAGVVGDPTGWMAATGIVPQGLDDILAARPSNVQERWFARIYFLKPLAIVVLAASALAIGVAQFVSAAKLAAAVVPGISASVFASHVLPGLVEGAVELLAGLAVLVRRTARCALIAMLVVAVLRTLLDVALPLSFTLFPFAAIGFDLPMLLAVLFTLAVLDER